MSTTRKTLFLNLVSLLKYFAVLLCLISIPKTKASSELNFKLKFIKCDSESWPQIIEKIDNKYTNPSSVKINGEEKKDKFSNGHCLIPEGDSISITLTYENNFNSYEKMFYSVSPCLQEITIVSFKTEKPTSMRKMFYGTNFQKIIFQDIDTSLVENMDNMFENCY